MQATVDAFIAEHEPMPGCLFVLRDTAEPKTASGIWLPRIAQNYLREGRVAKVGPGAVHAETGETIPPQVAVGDDVRFNIYGCAETPFKELLILPETAVECVVEASDT